MLSLGDIRQSDQTPSTTERTIVLLSSPATISSHYHINLIELSEQIKSKANVDRWKNSIIEHELILFLGSEAELR